MGRARSADALRLGKSYCKQSVKWRVSNNNKFNFSTKNSKPFRVSKNGVPIDAIKKTGEIQNNNHSNTIHINLHRNMRSDNMDNNIENNIELDNNINQDI